MNLSLYFSCLELAGDNSSSLTTCHRSAIELYFKCGLRLKETRQNVPIRPSKVPPSPISQSLSGILSFYFNKSNHKEMKSILDALMKVFKKYYKYFVMR